MPGNRAGGLKAAATNKKRHGADFYEVIGKKGGSGTYPRTFEKDRELAASAGKKSKRGKAKAK